MSDPQINDMLQFYVDFQLLGLPFTGGWAEQPAHVIDIIKALKEEDGAILDEKRPQQGAGGDG